MSKRGLIRILQRNGRLNIQAARAKALGWKDVKVVIEEGGQHGYVRGRKPGKVLPNKHLTHFADDTVKRSGPGG